MTGVMTGAIRYSYATVALPTLSPEEAVAHAAAAGYRGLEWKVGEAPHAAGSTAETFLRGNRCTLALDPAEGSRAARLCADAGLEVVGLGPYVRTGDLATFDRVLDVAEAAGASQVRLQGPRLQPDGLGYRALFAQAVGFLDEAQARAARRGVRIVVETHQNTIFPSAALTHRAVAQFDPAHVGVIYDVGNLVFEGYENHRIAAELLGPYLHHVHLKNAAVSPVDGPGPVRRHLPRWSPLDDGAVDVAGVLEHLREIGYAGWVSVEDLSTERDPLSTLRHNAQVLTACGAPGWQNDGKEHGAMPQEDADRQAIRKLVEDWALWRDAGDWERFATVWHPTAGWMTATWFQGPAAEFIEASRAGFENGVRILHFLGGQTADLRGDRAISQTKMTISQRADVDGVEVDVVCTGRFYDFLVREGTGWLLVRRQPIYEKDRLDVVDPATTLHLDPELLAGFPEGYRHLAYVQTKAGFTVKGGLPGLTGEAVERLYAEGAAWLAGSDTAGDPL